MSDAIISLLKQPNGATIAEIATTAGIKETSARVLLSSKIKKAGHNVVSTKRDGVRYYSITPVTEEATAQAVAA